ncbi:hypothetical protein PPYR_07020 [Photinus pyralis]|uniref:Uncharacterized protein n=1 Tax=Photinus pyralis TaxID=7054 RepID=A0A5N4AP87_PHOPY|nr:hypothetical protein PPYR_07020 [Photinus pyralis]
MRFLYVYTVYVEGNCKLKLYNHIDLCSTIEVRAQETTFWTQTKLEAEKEGIIPESSRRSHGICCLYPPEFIMAVSANESKCAIRREAIMDFATNPIRRAYKNGSCGGIIYITDLFM